jgi:hypothetical protein
MAAQPAKRTNFRAPVAVPRAGAGPTSPQHPRQQHDGEQRQAEQVHAIEEWVGKEQVAQALQQVEGRGHVRPRAQRCVHRGRQQPQYRDQRDQQRDLVQQDRRVGLQEQHGQHQQDQPRGDRTAQHARRSLDLGIVGDDLAAAVAEPEQQRQQHNREDVLGALEVGGRGVVLVEKALLDRHAGRDRLQRAARDLRVLPQLPEGRGIDTEQPAVVVCDRGRHGLVARLDAGLDRVGAPAELDLLVDRPGHRLLGQRELGDDRLDAVAKGGRHPGGLRGGPRRFPDRTAPCEFGGILAVLAGRLLEFAAPPLELVAVEAHVPRQALEPVDRQQLQLVAPEMPLLVVDGSADRLEALVELRAGIRALAALDDVLRETLVGIGPDGDVRRGDDLRALLCGGGRCSGILRRGWQRPPERQHGQCSG